MKKKFALYFSLLLLFASNVSAAESPTDKGSFILSGSASYYRQAVENDANRHAYYIFPGFYYFIFNNIGLGTSASHSKFNAGNYDSVSYGAGPSIRFYLPSEAVKPFGSVTYFFNKDRSGHNGEVVNYYRKTKSTSLEFRIGVDYFIARNIALEPFVSYSISAYKSDYSSNYYSYSSGTLLDTFDEDSKEFTIGIGLTAFIF